VPYIMDVVNSNPGLGMNYCYWIFNCFH